MHRLKSRDTAQSIFKEREENSTEKKENLNKIYFSNVHAERTWAAMPGLGGSRSPFLCTEVGKCVYREQLPCF